HFDKFWIAIEFFTIGEGQLCRLDLQVDEFCTRRIKIIKAHAFEQCQLLEQDRSLAPDACLADGIAAVVVCQRSLDMCLPTRPIASGQDAAVPPTPDVHAFLGAAAAIGGIGCKAWRPELPCGV